MREHGRSNRERRCARHGELEVTDEIEHARQQRADEAAGGVCGVIEANVHRHVIVRLAVSENEIRVQRRVQREDQAEDHQAPRQPSVLATSLRERRLQ